MKTGYHYQFVARTDSDINMYNLMTSMSKTKKWCSHFRLIYSHKGDKIGKMCGGNHKHSRLKHGNYFENVLS
jgi:hypothetical protein